MGHYRSNLRDIRFNLFEVLGRQDVYGRAPFEAFEVDVATEILREVERLAVGPVASSYLESDRHPPAFDPASGTVTMPAAFARSYRAWMDSGHYLLDISPEFGGYGAPATLRWAVTEMVQAANPVVHMFSRGPWLAQLLGHIGTDDQRRFAELAIAREWASTMVLTEADAGSDVGAARTRAMPQPDGTWHIEGVKRFISGADHDLAENVFHLVLARPVGAAGGTKGLSMFLVPKYLVDLRTGQLGERNGVRVTNLEKKMGLRASPTCELTFGTDRPAVGYLVGGMHDGIRQMFLVIEDARMSVGTKAVGALSSGYLNALEFARTRVQGADLAVRGNPDAPRVPIIRHPDIRRGLMTQKMYAEGLRALILLAASYQDDIQVLAARGESTAELAAVNDLLLPIVKGFCAERAYDLLGRETLQVFGGSGYLQDYPIEQYVRDARINSIYEGTTAIQGLDLYFRKIERDNGASLRRLLACVGQTVASGDDRLTGERAALGVALDHVQAIVATLRQWSAAATSPANIYKVGLNTSRLLSVIGDVLVGWLLVRQASTALTALQRGPGADDDFYRGKVACAAFFCASVLPHIAAEEAAVRATSHDLMDLPDPAFG
jgi:alkylation response protein AidB-like acyl-CoA dehydrogenase